MESRRARPILLIALLPAASIDRTNVPLSIPLPINLVANLCGVSVNVLSLSTGGQAQCDAKSAPQELAQVVQHQTAAGG